MVEKGVAKFMGEVMERKIDAQLAICCENCGAFEGEPLEVLVEELTYCNGKWLCSKCAFDDVFCEED